MAWQDEFYHAMEPYLTGRAFQNFSDPKLARPLPAYYGGNLPRLITVKQAYDAENFFKYAQSIHG